MNYVSVERLTKHQGDKVLFEDISFGLNKGQKTAIVAQNGAGKTTLMTILMGQLAPDAGQVTFRRDIRVGYLEQDPQFDPAATALDVLFAAQNPITEAVRAYEALLDKQDNGEAVDPDTLQLALANVDAVDGWDYEARVKQTLSRLNITGLDRPTGVLSGGQRKRIALARVLLADPDVLLLDEPTNHLDIDMIEWLEQHLTNPNLTLLMVTHDRYFLDSVCNQIVELANQTLYVYNGNYGYYLEKKAERMFNEGREIDRARNLMRTELEWLRRQPKARGTKAKARVDAFEDLKERATQKKEDTALTLNVKMNRIGGKIMEIKNVTHAYGDLQILKNFTYTFKPKDRIGIVGRNGVGKSTFLNIILGLEKPNAGQVNLGETVVVGYYKQDGLTFRPDQRVIEVVKDIAEVIPLASGDKVTAAQFLTLFQFPPNTHYTEVARLSGGERRRLHLLTILMKNPNFLVLDEPTNDLDLPTLNVLEDFLTHYEGCLVMVSHDRYFMNRLVEHLFVFTGNGIVEDYNGTYTEWREEQREAEEKARLLAQAAQAAQPRPSTEVRNAGVKRKLTFNEQKEYGRLENEITGHEAERESLLQQLGTGTMSHDELLRLSNRIAELEQLIDSKTNRWVELSEWA